MRPCKYPFVRGQVFFGCGKCTPCLITRRKTWIHRLMLEQKLHKQSSFITLTYDDKSLPPGGTLVPTDLQNWLKRIRKEYSPAPLRYYGVGEYGENSERPHYHLLLFGGAACLKWPRKQREPCKCPPCRLYQRTWDKGFIYVGDVTEKSIKYVASYVSKSTLKRGDGKLLGRVPEFARMSLKPGIGYGQSKSIVDFLTSDLGCEYIKRNDDIPFSIEHGKKSYPLGNYLRRKIRKELGHDETAPVSALHAQKTKVQELLRENEVKETLKGYPLSSALRSIFKRPVSVIENKQKIFKGKKSL